jgi:hypothetical protein
VQVAAQFDAQRGASKLVTEPVEPVPQPTRVTQLTSRDGLGALAGTLGASERGGRRGANWTAVMALALVVVAAVGLISMLARRTPSGTVADTPPTVSPSVSASHVTATPSQSASSTPSSTGSSSTSPTSTPSTSPTDVLAQADSVVVKLAVTGRASWVRVTTGSGSTLYEGTLTSGQTKTFRDKTKIKLLLGNAGAVTLKVNGRDLGSPGSGGQVLKLTFVPGDPTTQSG